MYVTRPLSLYKSSPEAASDPPPEGPHSGYLVLADDEWEAQGSSCCSLSNHAQVKDLPFPQNKILTILFVENYGQFQTHHDETILFVPVLGHPLSSNQYYVIRGEGKFKGRACICSKKEDMGSRCFFNYAQDIKPAPLDHTNIYQQLEIKRGLCCGRFTAKSVSEDGIPPRFLARSGWNVHVYPFQHCRLQEAHGLDASLRSRRPNFDFKISNKWSSATVVGKWHCPFMFIKEEGINLRDQMVRSTFYEVTLQQLWEEIHRDKNSGKVIEINTTIRREATQLYSEECEAEETRVEDGFVWFRDHKTDEEKGVGLSMAIVERMKWEAARGGWGDGSERDVKVERVEEFKGVGGWSKYGCYMLVERFIFKRMDKSLVLTYDFRHTHQLQSKWE